MGARATSALAIAVVPYGLERKVEGTLHQMLAGALRTLRAAGCGLIGGHTCEGTELSLGAQSLSRCVIYIANTDAKPIIYSKTLHVSCVGVINPFRHV